MPEKTNNVVMIVCKCNCGKCFQQGEFSKCILRWRFIPLGLNKSRKSYDLFVEKGIQNNKKKEDNWSCEITLQ